MADAFDFDLLEITLTTILDGKDARVRRYDDARGAVQREFYVVHRPDVVLLEGIHVLFDKRVRTLLSLTIFVDEDSDTRLARRSTECSLFLVIIMLTTTAPRSAARRAGAQTGH